MSVTISFRVSEDLEEFLESKAKQQMTTKSSVAQRLLAEKAREMMSNEGESHLEPTDPEGILEKYNDHWSRTEGGHKKYRLRLNPERSEDLEQMVRYYDTREGLVKRIREEYA
jgi:hypothetical protein